MVTCAPLAATFLADDRRHFLRQVVCQAQVEFSRLESPAKVIDSTLLTAMGALGAANGFSSWCRSGAERRHVVGRGLDDETLLAVDRRWDDLMASCFAAGNTSPDSDCTRVRILPIVADLPALSSTPALCILIGWRSTTGLGGLMGIGEGLKGAPFNDSDIDFLYHLVDHMLIAMHAMADNALLHSLTNELDQARQKAVEANLRSDALKTELEEAGFRLSGFNDIFHELSGLTESTKVMDAFLLVMLGIFSAQSGAILYADPVSGKTHAALRGVGATLRHAGPGEVSDLLAAIFGSSFGLHDGTAQAAAMPPEQFKRLDRFIPRIKLGVLFQIDGEARGVVCLGQRLVENPYEANDQRLLQVFTHTFLAFLKNSRSFETIARLHAEQQQKTMVLEKTVRALSESRLTIDGMEKAGERIKTAITRALRRTTRVSVFDIVLMVVAGTILGVIYNYASPSGIPLAPRVWQYPVPPSIDIHDAKRRMDAGEILMVDARPTEFFNQGHIQGALNLPLALFDFVYMMRFSKIDPQRPIVIYGRNVSRHYDEELAYQLTQRGHAQVFVLSGGLTAWQASGFEVTP